MKQTQFMIEVILNFENQPSILIRDPRGNVVKITQNPEEVKTFLEEVVEKLANFNPSSPSVSHEKGND